MAAGRDWSVWPRGCPAGPSAAKGTTECRRGQIRLISGRWINHMEGRSGLAVALFRAYQNIKAVCACFLRLVAGSINI